MTHRAELILDAVVAAVTGLTTTTINVKRGRVRAVEATRALSVEMGADNVNEESSFPFVRRELNIEITAHVVSNDEPDSILNTIREEVYNAVMLDRKFGLNFVIDTNLVGDDRPELSGEAEQIVGTQQMNYIIEYQHSWDDAGA